MMDEKLFWHLIVAINLSFVAAQFIKNNPIITVPALGRVARLGELYNSATDEFTQVSIMSKEIPANYRSRIGTPYVKAKYDIVETAKEKAFLLGIGGDIAIKAGIGIIEGSASAAASFLVSSSKKERKVAGAVHYEVVTDRDILEIFYDDMRNIIKKDILNKSQDTHVVVGIGWGASVIVEFEDQRVDTDKKVNLAARLRGGLDLLFSAGAVAQLFPGGLGNIPGVNDTGIGFGVAVEVAANVSIQIKKMFSGLRFSIFGDVYFNGVDYPTDATEILLMIQRIPGMFNRSNDGRGKQMQFFLMPIDRVREFVNNTNSTPPAMQNGHTECSCEPSALVSPSAQGPSSLRTTDLPSPTGQFPTIQLPTDPSPSGKPPPTGQLPTIEFPTGQPSTGQPPTGQFPTIDLPTGQPPTGKPPPTGQPTTPEPPTNPEPPTDGQEVDQSSQLIEHAEIISNKISELMGLLEANADIVKSSILRSLRRLRANFKNSTGLFKDNLKDAIILTRKEEFHRTPNPRGPKLMEDAVKAYINDSQGLYKTEEILDNDYKTIKTKINMVELLRNDEVTWVGRDDLVDAIFLQDLEGDEELMKSTACVLHFYWWYLDEDPMHFFRIALKAREKARVYVTDCDFPHPSCNDLTSRELSCNIFFSPNFS